MFSLREPFAIVIAGLVASLGCKARATPADCDALVRHFAEVSAKESGLDPASPEAPVYSAARGYAEGDLPSVRREISSGVLARPRISLRCGKRPNRRITSRCRIA